MKIDPALASYFAEAASWDADRAAQRHRSVRIAWAVAVTGWLFALMVGTALMLLMPLKTVEPFVIRVDNTTGIVDVVPIYEGKGAMPELLTRYLLEHYVTVCERFSHAMAEMDYAECAAFHTPQLNQAWYAAWNKINPNSPLVLYKDGTTVRANVTSISFFNRASGAGDLAQIRYVKTIREAGGGAENRSHWIATVQYAYGEPAKKPEVRHWNPLGFKIIEFRAEREISEPRSVDPSPRGSAPPAGQQADAL